MHPPIDKLFPAFVNSASLTDFEAASPLWPDEEPAVATAGRKRQLDYQAGRHCAREALRKAGQPPVAIGRGARREPLWPGTFVGAITHTQGLAAAAVARRRDAAGIGLDIEARRACDLNLWRRVGTTEERTAAETGFDPSDALLLTFSAKEAFYKAQFTVSGQWLGFLGAAVRLNKHAGSFELTLVEPVVGVGPVGTRVGGRFAVAGEFLCTGVCLPGLEEQLASTMTDNEAAT